MMITKETTVKEILRTDDRFVPIMLEAGVHSLDCAAVLEASLESVCEVHGTDAAQVATRMNEILAARKTN